MLRKSPLTLSAHSHFNLEVRLAKQVAQGVQLLTNCSPESLKTDNKSIPGLLYEYTWKLTGISVFLHRNFSKLIFTTFANQDDGPIRGSVATRLTNEVSRYLSIKSLASFILAAI